MVESTHTPDRPRAIVVVVDAPGRRAAAYNGRRAWLDCDYRNGRATAGCGRGNRDDIDPVSGSVGAYDHVGSAMAGSCTQRPPRPTDDADGPTEERGGEASEVDRGGRLSTGRKGRGGIGDTRENHSSAVLYP
uniref:Uncharacterized protein n=1 Tax=Plectus sambesii TaxID=2011161 RepID=A0A914WV21_9BILA